MQLSSIGAAAASVGSSVGHGVRSLGKGLEFAGQLDKKLRKLEGNGALGQLAALLQAGTPLAAIANAIAENLSGAIGKAAGDSSNTAAQAELKRALASALAPPGTSPPGSGAEQAAALEQRLTDVVNRLTRELNDAGQQSEFSGTVLDANSAKENPAQQTNTTTGEASQLSAALTSFVQSLINGATSAQADPSAAAASTAAGTPQIQAQAQPQQALPDILARMLSRAANADAARTVPSLSGTQHVASPGDATAPSPSALFERLIAVVAEQQAGSHSDSGGEKGQSQESPSTPQSSTSSAPASFAAQAASAPATAGQTLAQTPSALHYTTVDPQAVIEQLVKGISMRTSGDSSELRLRLQPEHLGDVALKLTVTGTTINANVIAQNADVRDVLLSHQQHLARSLAEAGLSLGKFSVDVSGGNAGFTQQQSKQQAQAGKSIAVGGSLLAGEDGNWEDQRFGPSLISSSGSLVFNYLA